jgi:Hyaluronidase
MNWRVHALVFGFITIALLVAHRRHNSLTWSVQGKQDARRVHRYPDTDQALRHLQREPQVRRTRTQSLRRRGVRLGLSMLTLLTLAGCSAHRLITVAPPTAPQAKFLIFDATLYQAKPDLTQSGLTPISVDYGASLWPGKSPDFQSVPDETVVRTLASDASQSTGIAVVDIEQWQVVGDPATVAQSLDKYQTTLQMYQSDAPSLQVGYYSVAPLRDYWDALAGPQSAGYLAWQQKNDKVARIAQQANALFPSAYTFYTDQVGWQQYAIAQIAEARRIAPDKPVYLFLWPQYDDGKGGQGGDYLPDAYWKMELETARKYGDGVVIWGGWTHTWDSKASWWLTTQEFITEIRANYTVKGIRGCQGQCPPDHLTTASDATHSPLQ